MNFSDMVKYARAELNISQETLSKQIGVSFATVNRWENGKVEPNKLKQYALEQFCKKHDIAVNGEVE